MKRYTVEYIYYYTDDDGVDTRAEGTDSFDTQKEAEEFYQLQLETLKNLVKETEIDCFLIELFEEDFEKCTETVLQRLMQV